MHRPSRLASAAGLLCTLGLPLGTAASGHARPTPVANSAPVVPDVSLDAEEDNSLVTTLKATDADSDALRFKVTKPARKGQATLTTSGQLTYTPNENFHGKDDFTFEVTDGKAKVTKKAVVQVSSVNDRPTATVPPLSGTEDKPVTGQVSGTDADGDPLQFFGGSDPKRGAVTVEARTGRFTFTPAPDAHGVVTFSLRMTDGTVDVDVPVSVTLAKVNDAPATTDASASTREDVPFKGKLTATDVDGDTITFAIATRPAHGTVTLEPATGTYVYTPQSEFHGEDGFGFTVSDGTLTAKGRVTVDVQNVNDPPTLSPLALEGSEDTVLTAKAAAKDFDGDTIYFKIVGEAKHGDADIDHESGAVSYTPRAQFFGTDQFIIEASDISGGVTTPVKVTVKPVNDAPTAPPDTNQGPEDQPLTAKLRGEDIDNDALRYALKKPARSGRVEVKSDGSFTFVPQANFNGEDSFDYEVSDAGARAQGTMQLIIKPVNDAPQAQDAQVRTTEDTDVRGKILATDIDEDNLSYVLGKSAKKGGVVVEDATGAFTYTPNANENGEDSFTVLVSDGPASVEAQVKVSITPVNDAPVTAPVQKNGDEDGPIDGAVVASDVDRDTLTFKVIGKPRIGTVELDAATGGFRFVPSLHQNGADAFTVEVSDGKLKAQSAVSLKVAAVNDAPDVKPLSLNTNEDKAVSGAVLASDVDKDKLTWSEGLAPKKGSVTVDAATGKLTYTPRLDENGDDAFMIEVGDGTTKSSTRVTVAIAPVNDAPVAEALQQDGVEDTELKGALVARDVDKDTLTYKAISAPKRGTVVVDAAAGTFRYTPRAHENGDDGFRFEVTDGKLRASADVKLQLAAVNDRPEAKALALTTVEDRDVSGRIEATDVDKDPLTFRLKKQGAIGQALVDDATGAVRYAPARDENGTDTFTVEVTDGYLTADSVVTVTVAGAPDAPLVDVRPMTVAEDEPATLKLSARDPDGDALTFKVLGTSKLGVAAIGGDGVTLTFTPKADVHGEDAVVLEATDGKNKVRATLPVLIAARNDLPTIDPITVDTPEEVAVTLALVTHDKDGDPVTLTLDGPGQAGVTLEGALLKVVPRQNFTGTLTVPVIASDPTGPSAAQPIIVNVRNQNDAPVVKDRVMKVAAGKTDSATLEIVDVDPAEELGCTVAVPPRQGTVTVDDARVCRFSYAAAATAKGEDSFRLRVKDKAGASASATVRVTVTAAPAPPKS